MTVRMPPTTKSEISRFRYFMNASVATMSCTVARIGRQREAPLEAPREVDQRDAEGDEHARWPPATQLVADPGADGLGAHDGVRSRAEALRRARRGSGDHDARRRPSCCATAARILHADRSTRSGCRTCAISAFGKPAFASSARTSAMFGGVRELQLHARAAGELDAPVEAVEQDQRRRPER